MTDIQDELIIFISQPNAFRSVLILFVLSVVAFWLSNFVAKAIIKVAQLISVRADNTNNEIKLIKLRRVETYLSITVAIVRALTVAIVSYVAWRNISPASNSSAAAIGASAFFIVLAGSTIGLILRDVTAGAAMIVEGWFHVGDYIRVEPFIDLGGVVERITLRSTRLRSLNGEVVWLHNQYMHGVRVTPHGVRSLAVDVLISDLEKGSKLIEEVISTIPNSPLTVTTKLTASKAYRWTDQLWMVTVRGQTPPGREWLIENYFVDTIVETDNKNPGQNVIAYKPMVRFEDPAAEKSFRRAVRATRNENISPKS